MKKAIKTLWEGLKAVFSVIVDWVATLFGMKDDSKYSKDLRRLVSASFTIVVMLWAVCSLVDLGFNIYDHFRCTSHSNHEVRQYTYPTDASICPDSGEWDTGSKLQPALPAEESVRAPCRTALRKPRRRSS